ncbi:Signal-induced proliferation-associated protein 1 [Geranomyces variabilis]|uniref:Signal-induced proliferation-associated protein 1 n=1 Tax=Geranomyces variabilis TaxID=109894 RepID=A0AAD5TSG2_9FUNG|nr:Signal-induced proliferation-associated protein 1 [Geranomyces variabilis]
MEAVMAHSKFYHKGVMNYETFNGAVYCTAHIPKTTSVMTPGGTGSSGRRASEELQFLTAHMAPPVPVTTIAPTSESVLSPRSPFDPASQRANLVKAVSSSEGELSRAGGGGGSNGPLVAFGSKPRLAKAMSPMQLQIPKPPNSPIPSQVASPATHGHPPQVQIVPGKLERTGSVVPVAERIKTYLDNPDRVSRSQTNTPLKIVPPKGGYGRSRSESPATDRRRPSDINHLTQPLSPSEVQFGALKIQFERSPPGLAKRAPSPLQIQTAQPIPTPGTSHHRRAASADPAWGRAQVAQIVTSGIRSDKFPDRRRPSKSPRARAKRPSLDSAHRSSASSDSSVGSNLPNRFSDPEEDGEDDIDEEAGSSDEGGHMADLHSSKWRSAPGLPTFDNDQDAGTAGGPRPHIHTLNKGSVASRSGTSSGNSSIQSLIRLNVTALTSMETGEPRTPRTPRTPETSAGGSGGVGSSVGFEERKAFSLSLDNILSDTKRKNGLYSKSPTTPTQPQKAGPDLSPTDASLATSSPLQLGNLARTITSQGGDLISIYEHFGRFRSRRSMIGTTMAETHHAQGNIGRKSQMETALGVFRGIMDSVRKIVDVAASLVMVKKLRAAALKLATKEREAEREIANHGVCDSLDTLREAIQETVAAAHEVIANFLSAQKELLITAVEGYRLEAIGPETDITPLPADSTKRSFYASCPLEHVDEDVEYYRKSFHGREHKNYIGDLPRLGPVIISLMFKQRNRTSQTSNFNAASAQSHPAAGGVGGGSSSSASAATGTGGTVTSPSQREFGAETSSAAADASEYWAIMRTREGSDLRAVIQASQVVGSSVLRSKHDAKAALQMLHRDIQPTKLRKISDPAIEKRLMALDELQYVTRYKFGVLYCTEGQQVEEDFFGNEHGSPGFEKFLTHIGDRIPLQGWTGYAAGLDTKYGQTGTHSIFTKYRQFDVMFHVSTYLPYKREDRQQIQRKRHIGNDIVTIVFLDGAKCHFDPKSVKSQFLHVFIAVQEDTTSRPGQTGWKVVLASNVDVPWFGPELPNPPVFWNPAELREFLLAKMINGENAAYKAPKFKKPHLRTRSAVLDEILRDYGNPPSKSTRSGGTSSGRPSVASNSAPASNSESPTTAQFSQQTAHLALERTLADAGLLPARGPEASRRQSVFASLGGAFTRRASVPSVAPSVDVIPPVPPVASRHKRTSSDATSRSDEAEPNPGPPTQGTTEALVAKKRGLKKLGRSKSSKTDLKSGKGDRKYKSTTALSSNESVEADASSRRKAQNSSSLLSAFSLKRKEKGEDKKYRSNESVEGIESGGGGVQTISGTLGSLPTLNPSKSGKAEM